nr:hypothetical protein [Tanacetum cinerariifolium]
TATTPIMVKIKKFKNLVIDRKAILVDEADNPMKRDSYGNGYYDEDPYDDNMCEGQDLSKEVQTICIKLDI